MKTLLLIITSLFIINFLIAQKIERNSDLTLEIYSNGDLSSFVKSKQLLYSDLDTTKINTGILYDKIILFSNVGKYTGDDTSNICSKKELKQIYFEINNARVKDEKVKPFSEIESLYNPGSGIIPITVINYKYNKIKENAEKNDLLQNRNGRLYENKNSKESPYLIKRVFATASIVEHTYHGANTIFNISKSAYLSNCKEKIKKIQIDFDDDFGYREVSFDQDINIYYSSTGIKNIILKFTDSENTTLNSSFQFEVLSLSSPSHTDIPLTASIPYNGILASGTAYLYKSPLTSGIENPIILIEGFDINNNMFADELYSLINQEKLAECLLNNGYDIIILNFTESKTYIQANAMLVIKLIQHVNDNLKIGNNGNIIIGASMGGLVARYALRYMETHSLQHETRLFVSFDSPQKGANVPLGDQYWIDFFASESEEAATKIIQLNSVAAQQMLVYHNLSFPFLNQYRTTFVNDLTTLGYPQNCRNIAISNGTANSTGQPYNPGDQIVSWNFRHWKVDIDGNAWAVPNVNPLTEISYCRINKFGPFNEVYRQVKVSGTLPYDNAPGGWRSSNQEIADGSTYSDKFGGNMGDITTTNPNHCFIPTISSLDINTNDLFYNLQSDPNILSKTPFKAIYYPTLVYPNQNQTHIFITTETVNWIMNELVPDNITLDGTTWNKGEFKAKNSITLLPGFQVDVGTEFHATIGIYSPCSSSINLKSMNVNKTSIVELTSDKLLEQNDFIDDKQILIYPNPNNGQFTLVLPIDKETEIEVISILGKTVYKSITRSNITSINISDCCKGIYTIILRYDNNTIMRKIIIK